jgi:hypothetical protein
VLILTIPFSPSAAALYQLTVCLLLFISQNVHDLAADCIPQRVESRPHLPPQFLHIYLLSSEDRVDHRTLFSRQRKVCFQSLGVARPPPAIVNTFPAITSAVTRTPGAECSAAHGDSRREDGYQQDSSP